MEKEKKAKYIKKEKILEIIYSVVDEVNQLNDKFEISKKIGTRLLGGEGNLDSLGLVNLIVGIEQKIEDEFNVSITLADERAMSQKHSPFKTIGSLVDYINMLLKEV